MAYKTPYSTKFLCIIFNKADGYIRKDDKTKYLALFYSNEKCEKNFDRFRYLILLKSNILDIYSHKCKKIKINSDNDLLLEKTINMHNAIILIISVFNENHNRYYYKLSSEKCSYN